MSRGYVTCEHMWDMLWGLPERLGMDSHFHMEELIVEGCEVFLGSKHWGSILQDQFEAISNEI